MERLSITCSRYEELCSTDRHRSNRRVAITIGATARHLTRVKKRSRQIFLRKHPTDDVVRSQSTVGNLTNLRRAKNMMVMKTTRIQKLSGFSRNSMYFIDIRYYSGTKGIFKNRIFEKSVKNVYLLPQPQKPLTNPVRPAWPAVFP